MFHFGCPSEKSLKSMANSSFICFGFLVFPNCFCVFNVLVILPALWQFLHLFAHNTICLLICGHRTSAAEPSMASRQGCPLWQLFSTACFLSDGITSLFSRQFTVYSQIFKDAAKQFGFCTEQFNVPSQYRFYNNLETEIGLVIGQQ